MADPSIVDRVDAVLAAFLDARSARLTGVGSELEPLIDQARTFVLDGGKRLRPTFAYWGWRSARTEADDDTRLITAAASLELLHACALVHDDVMDASATRRGRPATHAAFATLHHDSGWTGDADSFGAAAAILLGDLLLSWADALFSSARPNDRSRAVFDEMRELVMAGQYLDVLVQARGGYAADDAVRVIMFKTSKYTIEGPLLLGAAAAEAPPERTAVLSRYGLALGEAFQLRDDLLGVFGDPALTGKPAGDDLREGKRTLLVAHAMAHASAAQADLLRDRLGQRDMSDDDVTALRAVLVETGAVDEVEARIAARATEARAALDDDAFAGPELSDVRAALDALAAAASVRTT